MPTRWDVEKAVLRSSIPPLARLIVLVLAIKSDNKTAVVPADHTPSLTTLSEMTGISRGSLTEWLLALEAAGWVTRSKPAKRGSKTDKTTYALDEGSDEVALRDRATRIPKQRKATKPTFDESGSSPRGGRDRDALLVREADVKEGTSSPRGGLLLVREADGSSPRGGRLLTTPPPTGEGTTKNHHAATSADEPVNPPPGDSAKWDGSNLKPTASAATYGRAAALFPKPKAAAVESWMEIHQVIYRWLQANDYDTFGLDEVRQIHTQLIAAHPGKPLRYMTSVIGNGGCVAYAEDLRKARNKKISEFISDMQATLPQCPHGIPAGEHPHPTRGHLLCIHCRRGLPAIEQDDTTDPRVQATLDAYRRTRGNNIFITELLNVTQQIEAFLAEGADLDDLTALAELAGAQGVSLIQAAGVAV